MTLASGTRLGPYEIQSALGAGGMGEVYRARDTRLGRDVAIKVLPAALSADAERLRRFEQEARAAAALNHPNILAVFDIGIDASLTPTGQAFPFIVMELLDGAPLREPLAGGALPVRKAVEYAGQVAHGLAAAHEKGIVHRDLKPENVFVTADGRVKILDFGLAKLTDSAPALAGASQAPTLPPLTTSGVVLGTVGYMAPEQVRGEAADHRSDIFALGCMLYEMVGGRRAFAAPTTAETMTAILREEPPELPSDRVPPGLARVVQRCLEKSPGARFKSADDLAFALEALSVPVATRGPASPGTVTDFSRARLAWFLAGVVLAAIVIFAVLSAGGRLESGTGVSGAAAARLELSLPAGVDLYSHHGALAVSPDGQRIAFIGVRDGVRQVYVRRRDQYEANLLRGTDGAVACFFAHDGTAIAFTTPAAVVSTVSLADGSVSVLSDRVNYTIRGAWGADNRITFTRDGALWQVPGVGGAARQLTTLDAGRGEALHGLPITIGDGRTLVFESGSVGRRSRIEALDGHDAARRVLVEDGEFPVAVTGGHLVFFRGGALFAARFDPDRLEVTGTPARVVENVAVDSFGVPVAVVSESGTLVYQSTDAAAAELVWVSLDGRTEPVADQLGPYASPRTSPDGRRLVVEASGDLWLLDTARSTLTRLTSDETAASTFPVWTPDGARVVFMARTNMRVMETDGSGRARDIPGTMATDFPSSVSPDGSLLAFLRVNPDTSGDVYVLSLHGEPNPRAIVRTPANESGPQFSPDGRGLAYVSNETGQFQIYLRSLTGSERRWQVSTDGGTSPRWSRDGRALYYRNGDRMMAVDVASGAEMGLSRPRMLFEQRYGYGTTITLSNYDVRPGEQGFVMVREPAQAARLNVVTNWLNELVRLAPAPAP